MVIKQSEAKSYDFNKFQYKLVPGKVRHDANIISLNNRLFTYWAGFWEKIYTEAGSPQSFNPDDFLRQDLIASLFYDGELIGMHLYSFFDIEQAAIRKHSYFKFYPEDYYSFIQNRGARSMMSFEFLTLDPNWRKSQTGLHFAKVITACGVHVALKMGIDAGIAPARADNKANEIGYSVGFEPYAKGIIKRNFPVDIMAAFRPNMNPQPDPSINSLISRVWETRQDFSGLTNIRRINEKMTNEPLQAA